MNIKAGKFIKIVFKNNSIIQGIVEEWSDKEVVLFNTEKNKQYIVYNISENALLVQVDQQPKTQIKERPAFVQEITELGMTDYDTEPGMTDYDLARLKAKKIAELKVLEAEQEREIVKNKLKSANVPEVHPVYQIPNFFKK